MCTAHQAGRDPAAQRALVPLPKAADEPSRRPQPATGEVPRERAAKTELTHKPAGSRSRSALIAQRLLRPAARDRAGVKGELRALGAAAAAAQPAAARRSRQPQRPLHVPPAALGVWPLCSRRGCRSAPAPRAAGPPLGGGPLLARAGGGGERSALSAPERRGKSGAGAGPPRFERERKKFEVRSCFADMCCCPTRCRCSTTVMMRRAPRHLQQALANNNTPWIGNREIDHTSVYVHASHGQHGTAGHASQQAGVDT